MAPHKRGKTVERIQHIPSRSANRRAPQQAVPARSVAGLAGYINLTITPGINAGEVRLEAKTSGKTGAIYL